jgi:hypothetical protein
MRRSLLSIRDAATVVVGDEERRCYYVRVVVVRDHVLLLCSHTYGTLSCLPPGQLIAPLFAYSTYRSPEIRRPDRRLRRRRRSTAADEQNKTFTVSRKLS